MKRQSKSSKKVKVSIRSPKWRATNIFYSRTAKKRQMPLPLVLQQQRSLLNCSSPTSNSCSPSRRDRIFQELYCRKSERAWRWGYLWTRMIFIDTSFRRAELQRTLKRHWRAMERSRRNLYPYVFSNVSHWIVSIKRYGKLFGISYIIIVLGTTNIISYSLLYVCQNTYIILLYYSLMW